MPKQHCGSCYDDLDRITIIADTLYDLENRAIERLVPNRIWGFPLSEYDILEQEYVEFQDVSVPTERNEKEWDVSDVGGWLTRLFSNPLFIEGMEAYKTKQEQLKQEKAMKDAEEQVKRESEEYLRLRAKYESPGRID
jgi:hypothetical protein